MPDVSPPLSPPLADVVAALRLEARRLGFDTVGLTTPAAARPAGERLRDWLAAGRHGEMTWMAEHADRRADPLTLWPEARTVVMVGQSYAPPVDPMAALAARERGVVSVYAKGRDYHNVLKQRLKVLARWLSAAVAGADVKVFVDTAPLMEKPLAAAAGLGWQGKHTNLVSRTHGSWLFLGSILTTAVLPVDQPEDDHCGSCRRCIDICPTTAIPAPYQLDARRCIAYLTIEHKGHIPLEFREPMGNRVFGCDDCLAVCPWNKFAEASQEAKFAASSATDDPPLSEWLALDDTAFRKRFAGTPVKRTGRDRLVRNALIAAGNSGVNQLYGQVAALAADASALVRAMVAWAAPRLGDPADVARLRDVVLTREHDDAVRREWQRGGPGG